MKLDLNSDLGEGGDYDEEIFELVTSANIACGFHAGDSDSILCSIETAREKGVAVGAHPSFADRENFGRNEVQLSVREIFNLMTYQLGAFQALCRSAGVRMNHVKPHGALYNMAWRDKELAGAIARAVQMLDPKLVVFAQARSALEGACASVGLATRAEVFADRNYMPDGSLVARSRTDALLTDPRKAAARAVKMVREGTVRAVNGHEIPIAAETICVHGDTPAAVEFVRELRGLLLSAGVELSAADPDRTG